jgi:hypothetical protein
MLLRVLWSLGVWVIATIVCLLLGALLATVGEETVSSIGAFLKSNAGLIGFLCGLVYFFFGSRFHPIR